MGIKGLWPILAPYCELKSLHEVSGQTVAVDLAGWLVDSQQVASAHNLYLRNLVFRTRALLLSDVRPVFVLDGRAPAAKEGEMQRRRGGRPAGRRALSRRRFRGLLEQGRRLLTNMGVTCLQADGEAEAMCAALNARGLVDAVVTQDSDCLAHGARRVYRNLALSAGGGVVSGTLLAYDADKIRRHIGLGRHKMIALGVVCGCDYGGGGGGGVRGALAWLATLSEEQVLGRLRDWAAPDRARHYEQLEERLAAGSVDKSQRAILKWEVSCRRRVLASAAADGGAFPPPHLLEEFLRDADTPAALPDPPPPDLLAMVKCAVEKLGWTERYSVEKVLPLMTRAARCPLGPSAVLARRKVRGVLHYRVGWDVSDSPYEGLVSDDQLNEGETEANVWQTWERADTISDRYPNLVTQYEASLPAKKTRRRKRTVTPPPQHTITPPPLSRLRPTTPPPAAPRSPDDLAASFLDLSLQSADDSLSEVVENLVSRTQPLVKTAVLASRRVRLTFLTDGTAMD